jgi:hypothetical protein
MFCNFFPKIVSFMRYVEKCGIIRPRKDTIFMADNIQVTV